MEQLQTVRSETGITATESLLTLGKTNDLILVVKHDRATFDSQSWRSKPNFPVEWSVPNFCKKVLKRYPLFLRSAAVCSLFFWGTRGRGQ